MLSCSHPLCHRLPVPAASWGHPWLLLDDFPLSPSRLCSEWQQLPGRVRRRGKLRSSSSTADRGTHHSPAMDIAQPMERGVLQGETRSRNPLGALNLSSRVYIGCRRGVRCHCHLEGTWAMLGDAKLLKGTHQQHFDI